MKIERKRNRSELPEAPMKLIRMPDRSRGLRINCPGCFVILERTKEGTRVIVQPNVGMASTVTATDDAVTVSLGGIEP